MFSPSIRRTKEICKGDEKMVGVPIDLLLFESMGIIMGEGKKKKKTRKRQSRSRKQEEKERYEKVLWRPSNPWPLP